jgi:2-iminobutanoate/2-iminopropanoate deaminase
MSVVDKALINPAGIVKPMGAYSHAVSLELGVGRLVFVSSQLPVDENGKLVSADVESQARCVFESIGRILSEAGASFDDVVKVQIHLRDITDFPKVSPVRNHYLGGARPASTLLEVGNFLIAGCRISVDAVALVTTPKPTA